jgi:hypothetical protein
MLRIGPNSTLPSYLLLLCYSSQGAFSFCLWFLWTPPIYFCLYDFFQGDVRWYRSWGIVTVTLREINQIEKEMCTYKDRELTIHDPLLPNFENRPNSPKDPTVFVSRRTLCTIASQSNTPFNEKSNITSPVPGFGSSPSKGLVHPF